MKLTPEYLREYRARNPEKTAAIYHRYYEKHKKRLSEKKRKTRASNKDILNEKRVARNRKHPERRIGREKTKQAVAKGKLLKEPCQECYNPKADAHHPDYSKPLEIVWLCRKHHLRLHQAKTLEGRTLREKYGIPKDMMIESPAS